MRIRLVWAALGLMAFAVATANPIGASETGIQALRDTDELDVSKSDDAWNSRFVLGDNGVVIDMVKGQEWLVGPDRDTTWAEAKTWVEGLDIGGGWRMPSKDELAGIYREDFGTNNMSHLFKTTGGFVWTDEMVGKSHAWGFCFEIGSPYWPRLTFSDTARAFAVRARQ